MFILLWKAEEFAELRSVLIFKVYWDILLFNYSITESFAIQK